MLYRHFSFKSTLWPELCPTGPSGRGDTFVFTNAGEHSPKFWNDNVPKSLKSLIQMKVARPLTMQVSAIPPRTDGIINRKIPERTESMPSEARNGINLRDPTPFIRDII
jgi:hypothetical protein